MNENDWLIFSNLNQLIVFLPSSGLPAFCDVQMHTFFTVIPIFIVPHILNSHTSKITVYFFRNDATIFNGIKRKDFFTGGLISDLDIWRNYISFPSFPSIEL